MNNQSPQSPLVPQGSTLDPKNQNRARVKLAVFFVLAIHGVGLLALLLQGCHREDAKDLANQNTNTLPVFEQPTNSGIAAGEPSVPPTTNPLPIVEATNGLPALASEYTVARGDTFATIAHSFKVSTKAMIDANPGVEATKLKVGQKLHVPAPAKTIASASGSTGPAAEPSGQHHYTVKSGDTLIKIATEHHTTARAIRTANSLKSDRIIVGQKLKLPVKVASAATTENASVSTIATA